jgi:hypothetical protein
VLYCDGTAGGGTAVYVDEGRPADLKSFPEHAGLLDAGDEGVVVADVDLGYERPGRSTRYAGAHPVTAVAAATLVYRANPTAEAYARWLEEAQGLLGRDDDDALEELAKRIEAGRDLLLNAGALSGGAARGGGGEHPECGGASREGRHCGCRELRLARSDRWRHARLDGNGRRRQRHRESRWGAHLPAREVRGGRARCRAGK